MQGNMHSRNHSASGRDIFNDDPRRSQSRLSEIDRQLDVRHRRTVIYIYSHTIKSRECVDCTALKLHPGLHMTLSCRHFTKSWKPNQKPIEYRFAELGKMPGESTKLCLPMSAQYR